MPSRSPLLHPTLCSPGPAPQTLSLFLAKTHIISSISFLSSYFYFFIFPFPAGQWGLTVHSLETFHLQLLSVLSSIPSFVDSKMPQMGKTAIAWPLPHSPKRVTVTCYGTEQGASPGKRGWKSAVWAVWASKMNPVARLLLCKVSKMLKPTLATQSRGTLNRRHLGVC